VKPCLVILSALILLMLAYIVFRQVVRKTYRSQGRLNFLSSTLQLFVFLCYFCFPYVFAPPAWPWFWRFEGPAPTWLQVIGLVLICLGFIIAFGTMAWFGLGRALGRNVKGLICQGPYRISRNPQVLGGYLLVVGTAFQWPSFYSLGWVLMYALIMHWMVTTEEEHLRRVFGKTYQDYRAKVPRYLFRSG
jgi:protein-S-isoprenylcysteine O-methyltransferase Ste14